jgi:hypothetical protein
MPQQRYLFQISQEIQAGLNFALVGGRALTASQTLLIRIAPIIKLAMLIAIPKNGMIAATYRILLARNKPSGSLGAVLTLFLTK